MKNQGFAAVLSVLVLSSCIIEGYLLPQQRYSVEEYEEYARKMGSPPIDNFSNEIDQNNPTALAKEEGSMLNTIIQLAMKFIPMLMEAMTGNERNDPGNTDLTDDRMSTKSLALLGLKLFLTVVGGSAAQDRNTEGDGSLIEPLLRTVIGAFLESDDPAEADAMAKQATEVINLVMTLVDALSTSMSQRSFNY